MLAAEITLLWFVVQFVPGSGTSQSTVKMVGPMSRQSCEQVARAYEQFKPTYCVPMTRKPDGSLQ